MFKRIALGLFLAATTAVAQQEPAAYHEKVNVNLVLLDAVVTDHHGNQILGLDKNDFVVTENGVPQKIDSVDYFTDRELLNEPESKAPFRAEQVHNQRYFIFFFDKPTGGNLLFDRLSLARSAAKHFVDTEMKPADVAAVVADDVRLKVYSDFTADRKQLDKAIDATAAWGTGLTAAEAPATGPSILRALREGRMMNDTGTVYEALQALGDATHDIHARKNIILFSAGIHEPGEQIVGGMIVSPSRYYDPMIRALNRSNVTVYPLQLVDDPGLPPFMHQTLSRIANDTNGEYFQFNTSFEPALQKIEGETNGYYLIAYYTTAKGGRGYQKVDVALKNPDFRIRARKGYVYGD